MIIDFSQEIYSYEDLISDSKALAKQYKHTICHDWRSPMTSLTLLC